MSASLATEALKLVRARVTWVATAVVVVGVPLLALGFALAADGGGSSQLALKTRAMLPGEGWVGLLGGTGQILSVAMLLATAFVASWTFGREFADGTLEPLLLARASPGRTASAKLAVVTAWAVVVCAAAVVVAVLAGLVAGVGADGSPGDLVAPAARALVGGVLVAVLALPVAFAASAGRSALAGVGTVLGIVVVTQVVTVTGAGAWFPYAAPGLWLGMGGPDVAVSAVQLLLALPVAAAGWVATVVWWERAEIVA
ncbi:ABC transporter permease [Oerskovia flava]|uniref:ABC transporter permease n=1 Tax=Oerskovia flava TaxID=2986422 RepID=UPI0022402DC6|nr:ABC transporter permease [Oerskovia sp. JB1-3-2]